MKQVFEYINNASINNFFEELDANINYKFINESIQSTILRDLIKQITERIKKQTESGAWHKSPTFKKLFTWQYVAWDQVKDEDFEISYHLRGEETDKKFVRARNDFEKKVRTVVRGGVNALVLLRNPKTQMFTYFIDNYGDLRDIEEGSMYGGRRGSSQAERMSYVKESDIYYLDLSKFSTRDKRGERQEAKRGVIEYDDYSLSEIARKNRERYKEIIAKNKMQRLAAKNDTIASDVEEIVNKVMELMVKINGSIEKYADLVWSARELNKMIYDVQRYDHKSRDRRGMDGLLYLFGEYTYAKSQALKSSYSDMYKRDFDSYKNKIENLIEKIYDKIEEIENKM